MADHEAVVHDGIDQANRNQWNNLVEQSDLGSVFHRYEWLRAVEEGIDHPAAHVVVTKGGNPVGLFPNFVTELDVPDPETVASQLPTDRLPAPVAARVDSLSADGVGDLPVKELRSTSPGFGGPVIASDERECLSLMFDRIAERCDRSILVHTIKTKELGYMRYGKVLARHGYSPTLLDCRFELNLDYDFEDLVARMTSGRRKAIRNAREADYEVSDLSFPDVVDSTYDRYVTDMERADGDVHDRAFFHALAEEIADRLKVFSVEVDGVEAGRYVHVVDDEQSTVHYFFSAIGDASNYEYNPTELLHSHAIEWGQDHGYRYYDFGSTGSTYTDGAFKYKERYGGRVIPTLQWEKGTTPVLWSAYKLGRRGYQRLAYGNQ